MCWDSSTLSSSLFKSVNTTATYFWGRCANNQRTVKCEWFSLIIARHRNASCAAFIPVFISIRYLLRPINSKTWLHKQIARCQDEMIILAKRRNSSKTAMNGRLTSPQFAHLVRPNFITTKTHQFNRNIAFAWRSLLVYHRQPFMLGVTSNCCRFCAAMECHLLFVQRNCFCTTDTSLYIHLYHRPNVLIHSKERHSNASR